MTALRLYVLGAPRLERGGQTLGLNLRRAVALIAYLAVTGQPHGRDRLAGLLWPECDDREARGRLRRTVHRLTEALGGDVLRAEGDRLRAAPDADLWVDSQAFAQHAAQGLGSDSGDGPPGPEQVGELERAAELYTGDFLAGFSLPDSPAWEEWQFHERENLRQTCARVLQRLVRAHQAQGDWEAAIGYARRRLGLDPLHEPSHRALMRLYAAAGQQAAALRQYQECVRLLEAELGVGPEEKTTALHEAIRTRRQAAARPRPVSPPPASPATAPQGVPTVRSEPQTGRRYNLPPQVTSFVGREHERALVAERLLDESTRLLTLTGPGGAGKTRLALQVGADLGERFEDGACFVALGPVRDPARVGWTIAQALDVREVAGRPILETVREYLRERQLLLVVDNLEHLLEAAPVVAELLGACPRLKVLATSRAALHLRGERELAVPPLEVPDPEQLLSLAALEQVPAVALFVERARDARPSFELTSENAAAVAEICRQLDGLPLAIELAAARVKLLPLPALLARLERRLALLTGGPRDLPERQQTLRDTIDWSYELLGESERALFCRLAVFVGGFDLEAAEAVAGSLAAGGKAVFEDLAGLVDQSLLQPVQRGGGEPGFLMLETIREYALEQLEASGEERVLRRLHAEYYLALAEEADPELIGPEQLEWLGRLGAEHANLMAALSWLAEQEEAWARRGLLRLAGSLHWYWWFGGRVGEGRSWLREALGREPVARQAEAARARALYAAGGLAMVQAEYEQAVECFEAALDLYQGLGDRQEYGRCLAYRGLQDAFRGEYEAARERFERAIEVAREIGDGWGLALAGSNLAAIVRLNDLEQAERLLAEYTPLARSTGDRYLLGATLPKWGSVAVFLGQYERGEALYREALSLFRELRDGWWTGRCLQLLGLIAAETDQHPRAARLLGAAWARLEAVGGQWVPQELKRHEQALARSRGALGVAAFERAWNEGQGMSAEAAVAYALGESDGDRERLAGAGVSGHEG